MTSTKQDLLAELAVLRGCFEASLLAVGLIGLERDPKRLSGRIVKLGGTTVDLSWVAQRILSLGASERRRLLDNLVCVSMRAVFTESFRTIELYACRTSQYAGNLETQPWFVFFKLVRNCLAHAARFSLRQKSIRRLLPVTWKGKTIDIGMDGQPLDFAFFSPTDAIELLADAEDYVKRSLA